MEHTSKDQELKSLYCSLDIEEHLKKIHHCNSEKFIDNPEFDTWSDRQKEHYQTLKRASFVANLVKQGVGVESAISQAWSTYPICTR